jgi:hypothetical protein
MNSISLFLACMFICFYTAVSAQTRSGEKPYKTTKFSFGVDSCFNKALSYLETHNYFIEAVDKASGFIRAKVYQKNNKVFSAQIGERRTISFLFRPSGSETLLSLNIYSEILNRGGNTSNVVSYYEDKGILDEPSTYQNLIIDLKKSITEN